MALEVHDTIVVCRPQQVREAAVVLSCCPADRFTPLIVVERPPITEEEYRSRYDVYVETRNRRDAVTGATLGQQAAANEIDAVRALGQEVDRKAETLTSYRGWWRHQILVFELLHKLPLRRAIFLFAPDPNELNLIHAIPMSRIPEERLPAIPENIERIYVLPQSSTPPSGEDRACHVYRALPELTDIAWRICERTGEVPQGAIVVSEADVSAYFPALWQALRLGLPLRPQGDFGVSSDAPLNKRIEDEPPVEAVVIEVSADASKLLGVQYAHQRHAKLILYPEPNTRAIEDALAAVEGRPALPAAGKMPRGKFLGALRDYFFGDPLITDGVRRIQRAVSRAVPDDVVAAVADLDVTAFTSAVPYNFVKKKGTDWSRKAIGHVAGDTTLLILTELLWTGIDTGVGFSLIFDPGYFETTETEDVLSALETRLSYPLVLRREASSSLSLIHVGQSLPLDFLFFNTHGADNAIVLSDGELPAFKLLQRQSLAGRPFVFNSSCLSWVGVGREFVRVGARGYIGTLWSVDAEIAADYARTVIDRVTHEGWPVARAMRSTGVDPVTESAYIFVGTCSARLDQAQATAADAERQRVIAAIQGMLASAAKLVGYAEGRPSLPFLSALEDLLLQEAERLLAEHDRRWPAPHLDRVRLSILHLQVLSHLVARLPDEVRGRLHLVGNAERMLQALSLEPKQRSEESAHIMQFGGRIRLRLGEVEPAIELLSRSVTAAEQAGESGAAPRLDLCDALRIAGRGPEALEVVRKADAAYALEKQPCSGRLYSLGRIAQLLSASGKYVDAIRVAQEGFKLATELDDLKERAEFTGDEARALLKLKRYNEALAAATIYLDAARQAHDDGRELSAYGVIAEALIGQNKLTEALEYIQTGLTNSRARGFVQSTGEFLMDMVQINSLNGDHEAALDRALEAASMFSEIGHGPKVRNALGRGTDEYIALVNKDKRANTLNAMSRKVKAEIALVGLVDPNLGAAIVTEVVHRIKDLISRVGIAPIRQGLHALVHDTQPLIDAQSGGTSDHHKFIARALVLFDDIGAGRLAEARQSAEDLDRLSQGSFQFIAFVDSFGEHTPNAVAGVATVHSDQLSLREIALIYELERLCDKDRRFVYQPSSHDEVIDILRLGKLGWIQIQERDIHIDDHSGQLKAATMSGILLKHL